MVNNVDTKTKKANIWNLQYPICNNFS